MTNQSEHYRSGTDDVRRKLNLATGYEEKKADSTSTSAHQQPSVAYDPRMTPVTQGELDAKLQLLQERMDNRVNRIEAAAQSIQSETSTLKLWLAGTGVAVVFGIASFNSTVLSNMVASFESGKSTAEKLSNVSKDQEVREQRLDRLERKLDEAISKKTGAK